MIRHRSVRVNQTCRPDSVLETTPHADLIATLVCRVDKRDEEQKKIVCSTCAKFALDLLSGIHKITVEIDNNNNATDQLPPVLPLDLIEYPHRQLALCLQQQRSRIVSAFGEQRMRSCGLSKSDLGVKESENYLVVIKRKQITHCEQRNEEVQLLTLGT